MHKFNYCRFYLTTDQNLERHGTFKLHRLPGLSEQAMLRQVQDSGGQVTLLFTWCVQPGAAVPMEVYQVTLIDL